MLKYLFLSALLIDIFVIYNASSTAGELTYKDCTLSWTISEDKIHFKYKARTQGWVGLGLNVKGSMDGAQLMMAGVAKNVGEIGKKRDVQYGHKFLGAEQGMAGNYNGKAWQFISAVEITENDGQSWTMVEWERMLNPDDADDIKIAPGQPLHVLLAYRIDDDIMIHGHSEMELIDFFNISTSHNNSDKSEL